MLSSRCFSYLDNSLVDVFLHVCDFVFADDGAPDRTRDESRLFRVVVLVCQLEHSDLPLSVVSVEEPCPISLLTVFEFVPFVPKHRRWLGLASCSRLVCWVLKKGKPHSVIVIVSSVSLLMLLLCCFGSLNFLMLASAGLIKQQSRLAHSCYLLLQNSCVCHICSIDFKQESLLTANGV